jgi:bacteriorhodopsin
MTITGLATFIATNHYYRIFQSWGVTCNVIDGTITASSYACNEAYRYVDWLLTVPLLPAELILVVGLSRS